MKRLPKRLAVPHFPFHRWLRMQNRGPDPDYWRKLLHPHPIKRRADDEEETVYIVIDEDLIDDEQYGAD